MIRQKKLHGPPPIHQCVDIHANDQFIALQPLSGYAQKRPETGSVPDFLEASSSAHALGSALIAALDRCRHVPLDDREFYKTDIFHLPYRTSHHEIMRRTGRTTKHEALENMIWLRVRREEGQIHIQPFRPDEPGTWDMLPEHLAVVIPETTDSDVVGAALVLALERGRTYAG